MRVCVIGLGEIGWETFKELDKDNCIDLCGVEISDDRIKELQKITDRDIKNTIHAKCDIYILSVYTPSQIKDVLSKIDLSVKPLIVIESTMLPGETDIILNAYPGIDLVLFPHRYNPNDSKHHVFNLNRIMGGNTKQALERAISFYKNYMTMDKLHIVSLKIAELSKPLENAYRYIEIAIAEEVKMECERLGINFADLRNAVNTKWNINLKEARDGIGLKCLAGDTLLLTNSGLKYLKDVLVNDYVYDGKEYTKVTAKSVRYVNETQEIIARGRKLRGSLDHIHFKCNNRDLIKIRLGDVKKDTEIYFPKISYFPSEPKLQIPARALGLYLAEGCLSKQKGKRSGSLIWTFGEREEFLADEICNLLSGYNVKKRLQVTTEATFGESRCWRIDIHDKQLFDYFQCMGFGTNSKNKQAPLLNGKDAWLLVSGWLDGNGSLYMGTINAHSESKLLIQSMALLFAHLNILCQIDKTGKKIKISDRVSVRNICKYTKRLKYSDDSYKSKTIYGSPTIKSFRFGWRCKVTKSERLPGIEVYSIETESQKYMANGIITHNCLPKDCKFISKFFSNNTIFKTVLDIDKKYREDLKLKGKKTSNYREID